MSITLQKDQCCSNCNFEFLDKDRSASFCRRYPPSAFPVVVPNQITQTMDHSIGTTYPPVQFDGWCGEWVEKIPAQLRLKQ